MSTFNGVGDERWALAKELTCIHNEVCFRKRPESELKDFVVVNKDRLNHAIFLDILSEAISFGNEYFKENEELCGTVYEIMQNTSKEGQDFGLRVAIRLGMFEDMWREYKGIEVPNANP